MKKIVVIGSINVDLVVSSERFPKKGETIIGNSFNVFCGGKGANQAVSASKLGGHVEFIGAVGDDSYGDLALNNLKDHGVGISSVAKLNGISTGLASITVAENDNQIVIIKGANEKINIEFIKQYLEVIQEASMVVLQFEIPLETVFYLVDYCYKQGIKTILNPAPFVPFDKTVIDKVTYFTPNETEINAMFDESYEEVLCKYPNKIIMTKGSEGAFMHDGNQLVHIQPKKVNVVDTTGAGDTFNGALAAFIAQEINLVDVLEKANIAAGISIGKIGAQSAMPTLDEVEQYEEA